MKRLWPLSLLLVCAIVGCSEPESWLPLAQPVRAPDFSVTALSGERIQLSSLKGKIVVLEFWATWCGPCRFTMPSLDLMYRRYRDEGVEVLLVNQQEDPEWIRRSVGDRFEAPIVLDSLGEVARKYNVRALPKLFIVDREGMLRYEKSGYRGGLEKQLSAILEAMMRTPSD